MEELDYIVNDFYKKTNDFIQKHKKACLESKSGIPKDAICFFKDGNSWCCVFGDFQDLVESQAGFGKTMKEALDSLLGLDC